LKSEIKVKAESESNLLDMAASLVKHKSDNNDKDKAKEKSDFVSGMDQ